MGNGTRINEEQFIQDLIQKIRQLPDQKMKLDDAAALIGMDSLAFHRRFRLHMGENYGAFVRRIRLEYACELMRSHPDWSCTCVAFEAGYSESSDFTRSFRRTFGIAPSRWDRVAPLNRLAKRLANLPDRITDSDIIGDASFHDEPGEHPSDVTLGELPDETMIVMQLKNITDANAFSKGWSAFKTWLLQSGIWQDDEMISGLSYDSPLDTPNEHWKFYFAYPAFKDVPLPKDYEIWSLPQSKSAQIICHGDVMDFVKAWDKMTRDFLPSTDWHRGKGPARFVFLDDPTLSELKVWHLEICLPIEMPD